MSAPRGVRGPRAAPAAALVVLVAAVACGGQGGCRTCGAPAAADAGALDVVDAGLAGVVPGEPDGGGLWVLAAAGDPDDLAALAREEGAAGLAEHAEAAPARRATALAALAYVDDLGGVPYLARRLDEGPDAEAVAAGASLVDAAARPRTARAPEEAEELVAACGRLLALARDAKRPRPRRVAAVRALRMLAERGCVRREDVPGDVDAP